MCHLLILLAAILAPQAAFPQASADVSAGTDTCITAIAESCPINYKDGWIINAVTNSADTVRLELQVPSSLAGFLSMLTGEGDNVKLLWLRQLSCFGDPWERLCGCVVAARRALVIDVRPKDSKVDAEIVLSPEDLERLTASIKD